MNTLEKYNKTSRGTDADAPMRVDHLRLVWIHDTDPDLSYLEQTYGDCEPGVAAQYQAQDALRLADYGKDWSMMGCYAEAVVSYPLGQNNRRLQIFRSGGLYGIESDCDHVYKKEVEKSELEDLATHLGTFGVPFTLPLEPDTHRARP